MDERPWKLRYTALDREHIGAGELTFTNEAGFRLGLQSAYRQSARELSGTFPDGRVIGEAALRHRYPPE